MHQTEDLRPRLRIIFRKNIFMLMVMGPNKPAGYKTFKRTKGDHVGNEFIINPLTISLKFKR